jgi:hypothetical protein
MNWLTHTVLAPADISDALPRTGWIVVGVIVAVGLLGMGAGDLLRFSARRIWAISGVCFRESIRRRVLWIIPLAVVGVIVVSQLQRAVDEQDALRQTTKFCVFVSGLVVVLTSIILACTNLPKEIDTRVIYLVVTKPTTRLELILGKIVGFARVTALILAIMGLFSYGYLSLRAWRQRQEVGTRLQFDTGLSGAERNKLQHYYDSGLLTAKNYAGAVDVQVMAAIDPQSAADAAEHVPLSGEMVRSTYGDSEQEFLFPYTMDRQRYFSSGPDSGETSASDGIGQNGFLIGVRVKWHRYGPQQSGPAQPTTEPGPPMVMVDVLDAQGFNLIGRLEMYDPANPGAKTAHTDNLPLPMENTWKPTDDAAAIDQSKVIWAYVPPSVAGSLYAQPQFFLHVVGTSHNVQYYADGTSAFLMMSDLPEHGKYSPPAPAVLPAEDKLIWAGAGADGKPAPPFVRGRIANRGGQELAGSLVRDEHAPFAVFRFRGVPVGTNGTIPLEFQAPIERGGDLEDEGDQAGDIDLTLRVRPAGRQNDGVIAEPVEMKIENKQLAFATLSTSEIGGGNFDLLVRCNTPGEMVNLQADSLNFVVGQEPFAWNLAKSLFILWLLTVLVVSLAVLCSTFLSWPIAVVLTVVLLMGHWAVTQEADANDKTLGRSIATDMGLTDPSKAEAVASSVNALGGALQVMGDFLPDIDHFSAIQRLEEGVVVSTDDMADALGVLAAFALPAAVLAYVVLKKKEVAP